jgi:hypothetical protein
MKVLNVNKLEFTTALPALDEISEKLDETQQRNLIQEINWEAFDYKPEVYFAIGYTDKEILLKYYISEDYFKAEMTETNQMVCEDSCVEFFVSPSDDGIYYNLEFNGIGTCLLGSGTGRENSIRANPAIVSKIRRQSSVGTSPVKETKGRFSWTITIAIPVEVFFHHRIGMLTGKSFMANFYKCGDRLSVPHYLTWNRISTKNPDYHQPRFFGMLSFI